ncbi:uncharacterized protein METZ01_LOCUS516783, partial [marine metagenome]
MTKKLEELLDLPEVKEAISKAEQDEIREVEPELADFELKPKEESPIKDLESTNRKLDKIEEALPPVDGLEDIGSEMDNIAGEAMKTYKDLMDLGMNVEARYSGRIF